MEFVQIIIHGRLTEESSTCVVLCNGFCYAKFCYALRLGFFVVMKGKTSNLPSWRDFPPLASEGHARANISVSAEDGEYSSGQPNLRQVAPGNGFSDKGSLKEGDQKAGGSSEVV
jgi:hypothetical protein